MKNPHLLGGGFSWPLLTLKLAIFLRFLTESHPPNEVRAKILGAIDFPFT